MGFEMDEYEEGEACYYTDNSLVDPDTDLSYIRVLRQYNSWDDPNTELPYIDEKLQHVLGHFQKDFEGGVSAENLGTKFGGYGSFLPTYQRSPSIRSHPKTPMVQNFSSPESPYVLPMEGTPLAKAQFTRLGDASQIAPSPCISDKNVPRLSSDQGKKLLVKKEPALNKQVNSSDQRSLKVRIKLNSDNAAKSKHAIYSGFGLNTTPSSSMGNSEDSSGIPSQCAGTMNESPSNILQIMTSFAVPDGSLLSPLVGSLLCLEMKENISQISSPKAIRKVPKEKKRKVVVKKENTAISNGDTGLSLGDTTNPLNPELDVKVENKESEIRPRGKNPNHISRNKIGADMAPLCNLVERNMSRKKIEVSKSSMEERSLGTVKDESLESVTDHNGGTFDKLVYQNSSIEKMSERKLMNFCKDEPVNVSRSIQSKRNEKYAISKADSNVSNCSRDVKDEFDLARSVEKCSFQGKNKVIGRQNRHSVDLVSEISGSLEVSKRKKKSTDVDNVKLEDDIKTDNCKAIQLKTTKKLVKNDFHNLPEGSLSKSNRGVVEKKQGSSLNKSRISLQKDTKARLASDVSLKESENDGDLFQQVEVGSMVEPNIAEPLVIEEDWVQCDLCEKWRLLPYGTNAQQLPEKWVCTMLYWLPGMNRCEISQDDTTQALHKLYQTESQSNVTNNVGKIYLGASSAEAAHLNPSSNNTLTPQNTKPRLKETHSNGGSVVIPGSVKNFQHDVVKSRSLNDMSSKFSEEKNALKHKEKHEKNGEKKLKNKRAADPCEYGTPKRTKVDATSGSVKTTKRVQNTGTVEGKIVKTELSDIKTHDEREPSLKKRKLKDWQESQKHDGNHHIKRKEVIKEETCDSEFRKIKNSALSNAEKNECILHKSDEKVRSIDKVNRGLGSEQCSKPANSSSSKVSNSLKNRSQFLEVKGSPVESVSSSPIRSSNLEQISPSKNRKLRKTSLKNGQVPMDSSKKLLNLENSIEINKSETVKKIKVHGISHSESTLDFRDSNKSQKIRGKFKVGEESPDKYLSVHSVKNEPEKLESSCYDVDKLNKGHSNDGDLLREKSRNLSSLSSKGKDVISGSKNSERIRKVSVRPIEMKQNPKEGMRDSRDLKCRIKLVKDNKDDKMTKAPQIQSFNNGVQMKSDLTREIGSSSQLVSNHLVSKVPPSISGPHIENEFNVVPADSSCCGDSSKVTKQCNDSPNLPRNDASSQSSAAFEEAEQAKAYAERLKDSGFPLEANDAYLRAILYFLHAASVRENCNYDSNKHGEVSPMQMYSSTAKLCELCAVEYEKRNDLANAALAYKCMEVAYFRVVLCKSSTMNRDRHDLQATLQNVPLGESPSSSASDVDSLNNQMLVDNKSAISRSVGSHSGNNHIITARNRPAIVRLLDCMKEVHSALEASNKSQNIYAAASQTIGQNNAGIISVKKAIDLSFQDVDEVVRLVRIAFDLISRQGFNGIKV